jgi:hypothetical protein
MIWTLSTPFSFKYYKHQLGFFQVSKAPAAGPAWLNHCQYVMKYFGAPQMTAPQPAAC